MKAEGKKSEKVQLSPEKQQLWRRVWACMCLCYLDLLWEQSHRPSGASAPHHHLVTRSHQSPGQRAGEVTCSQNADRGGVGVRQGGLKLSGASWFTPPWDQWPWHLVRHLFCKSEDKIRNYTKGKEDFVAKNKYFCRILLRETQLRFSICNYSFKAVFCPLKG